MNWNQIDHKKNSGKDTLLCPDCSHTRKRNKTQKCLMVDYSTGRASCQHCGEGCWKPDENSEYKKMEKEEKVYTKPTFRNNTDLPDVIVKWFQKRALKQETINKFKVGYGPEDMPIQGKWVKDKETIQYNYFLDGKYINTKFKTGGKAFKMVKDARKTLFNVDAIKDSEEVLFCEGEEETMCWDQAGYKYAVSVPNGAVIGNNNLEYLADIWDSHLANKKKVYIATDNDQAGEKLRDDLVSRFGKDICYIIEYPKIKYSVNDSDGKPVEKFTKDANDILVWEDEKFLYSLLEQAKGFPIEGIFTAGDISDKLWEMYNDKEFFPKGTTTYHEELDEHWTWRKGDYNIMYGPGNAGKSTKALSLCALKSKYEGDKWAVFSPEQNPPVDFYNDLMHTFIGKTVDPNFPTFQMNKAEFKKAMDFVDKHFIYVYPDEKHDKDTIFNIFKQVIIKHGVTGIIIDPLNQVDRIGDDAKIRDDQYISRFSTEFKRFIINHDVYSMVITHGDINFDEKSRVALTPNMYKNIEGGKMLSKKADNILAYWRPNFMINIRDATCILASQKIKKQKLTGVPGEVYFSYNKATNRYLPESGRCAFDNTVHTSKLRQTLIPLEQVSNIGEPEADDFFGDSSEELDDPFK